MEGSTGPKPSARLDLPEELTIFEVAAAHRDLCAKLDEGRPLVVQASRLHTCDTAGAQLIVAAKQAWRDKGLDFVIEEASEPWNFCIKMIGCDKFLASNT